MGIEGRSTFFQDFRNLRQDPAFYQKILALSLGLATYVLSFFVFLYLFLFIEDSLTNRRAKLPALGVITGHNLGRHPVPVLAMLVHLVLLLIFRITYGGLLVDLATFFWVPSALFTLVLYAYSYDDRSFFNLHKTLTFWKTNIDALWIPAGLMLLAILLMGENPLAAPAVVLALIYLINFIVNHFDEKLYDGA
ncbi:MAG: hypothetical protein K2L24_01965 [Opitutales bacterium]|nr:hypothetical protein [Opitutales bacterium]